MIDMPDVLHHFHKRKRIYKNYEPYPHPNKWKRVMDKLIYAAIVIKLTMTVPQVVLIWTTQNASGVSMYTWITYAASSTVWTLYGIMHKEKPIIISSTISLVLEITIVGGTIFYGMT